MIEYLHAHGGVPEEIYVVEDPRNGNNDSVRTWENTGYLDVAAATGCKLREPLTFACVKRRVPDALVRPVYNVAKLCVAPNTVMFNVPKMKTHNLSITTLGMKNLQGAARAADRHMCGQAWREMPHEYRYRREPRREWFTRDIHELWQERWARRARDLAAAIMPAMNVIEGVVGRDGTGFREGVNYALGLAVAGRNIVATDAVGSYLMGFDPLKLVYLNVAAESGLGPNDLNRIKVYLYEDGQLAPCHDLAALRAPTPFRVISRIKDESDTYAR
jgi:uncharacterized protein (DUF362 family)